MQIIATEYIIRIWVVAPQERLDTFSAPSLRSKLDELIASGVSRFVLDLSNTPFMDSAGMAVLVSLLKRARLAGGDVKLVSPQQQAAQRILHLTKFDRVFDMYASAEAARAAF